MEQTKIFFRIFPSVDHRPQIVQKGFSFKDFPLSWRPIWNLNTHLTL